MNNLIIVSNWEKVEKDDFYLSEKWLKEEDNICMKEAKRLQKKGNLYVAYIVDAKNYAIYSQMDANQVFINLDSDVILHCESAIIENNHTHRQAFEE